MGKEEKDASIEPFLSDIFLVLDRLEKIDKACRGHC